MCLGVLGSNLEVTRLPSWLQVAQLHAAQHKPPSRHHRLRPTDLQLWKGAALSQAAEVNNKPELFLDQFLVGYPSMLLKCHFLRATSHCVLGAHLFPLQKGLREARAVCQALPLAGEYFHR